MPASVCFLRISLIAKSARVIRRLNAIEHRWKNEETATKRRSEQRNSHAKGVNRNSFCAPPNPPTGGQLNARRKGKSAQAHCTTNSKQMKFLRILMGNEVVSRADCPGCGACGRTASGNQLSVCRSALDIVVSMNHNRQQIEELAHIIRVRAVRVWSV